MELQPLLPFIAPLIIAIGGYGAVRAEVKNIKETYVTKAAADALSDRVSRIEQSHVTRPEVEALSKRLDEVVSEIKGLRSDLMTIIRER